MKNSIKKGVRLLCNDRKGWILLTVASGWLVTLGFRFFLPVILPQIKVTFGLDNATVGLAVTLLWVCYALIQFPAGMLGDHLGERKVLTGSLLASAVSLVLLALSPLFVVFLVAASLFGLSSGLYGPTRGTIISSTFPRNDGTAFGIVLAIGSIGSALFPFLAGLYVSIVGWRILIAISAPVFLLLSVIAWVIIPVDMVKTKQSVRKNLQVLPQSIRDRGILITIAAVTLMLFVLQGLTTFLPTYLIMEKSISQPTASTLFAGMFISGAVAQLVAGRLADMYGDSLVLIAFSVISIITVGLLPLLHTFFPLALLVLGLGTRLAVAPVANAYIIDQLPDEVQGSAWGLLRTVVVFIAATGSVFVGVFADFNLFDEVFYVLAVLTGIATGLFILLANHEHELWH